MANEIQFIHDSTGENLYFVLRNLSAQMWNTSGTPAWEARTVAHWDDYDSIMSETPASSFLYIGDMPAVANGWYWVDIYEQLGVSPAIADDTLVAQMLGHWNGTAFSLVAADVQTVLAVVPTPVAEPAGGIASQADLEKVPRKGYRVTGKNVTVDGDYTGETETVEYEEVEAAP